MSVAAPPRPLRLLLVEDNPGDARLVRELLKDTGEAPWPIAEATSLARAVDAAASTPCDAVLLDLGLPDSAGLETVRRFCASVPEPPVVVLTGLDDDQAGIGAVQAGAQDYLVKGALDGPLLARTVRHAVERKRSQEQLARLAAIVESSDDAIVGADAKGLIRTWNDGARRLFGLSADEATGRPLSLIARSESSLLAERIQRALAGETLGPVEIVHSTGDRGLLEVSLSLSPLRSGGRLVGVSAIGRDVTPLKRAQELLARGERLDSLGAVAGGVAHHFNNLFTVALGSCERALATIPADHPARGRVHQVIDALRRAADISREMVAVSGRGALRLEATDLSEVVESSVAALRERMPEGVTLKTSLEPRLPPARVDADQVRQALTNLVLNACEAVAESAGTVTVSTALCTVTGDDPVAHQYTGTPLGAGRHVLLQVRDDGPGMSQATRERMFDPFFSTKFVGRGLGLATVLGIVRGHRGGIRVESEPGRGTVFTMLFPCAAEEGDASSLEQGEERE